MAIVDFTLAQSLLGREICFKDNRFYADIVEVLDSEQLSIQDAKLMSTYFGIVDNVIVSADVDVPIQLSIKSQINDAVDQSDFFSIKDLDIHFLS